MLIIPSINFIQFIGPTREKASAIRVSISSSVLDREIENSQKDRNVRRWSTSRFFLGGVVIRLGSLRLADDSLLFVKKWLKRT